MPEYTEQRHRDAAPAWPSTDALERVRAGAIARAAKEAPSRRSWVAVPLMAAATIAVMLGVALTAGNSSAHIVPGISATPVFAKERALTSLQPPKHGVMHTRRSTPFTPDVPEVAQTVDEWFDLDGHAYRSESRGAVGELTDLDVMSGGRMVSLWSLHPFPETTSTPGGRASSTRADFGLKTVDHQVALSAKDDQYYSGAADIRQALDAGEAKISGPAEHNGSECWVVEYGDVLADGAPQYRAYLRTKDYSLVSWRQSMGGNGPAMVIDFAHENIDRRALPADFFSLQAPGRAVPSGQITVRQHVSSLPSPDTAVDTNESVNADPTSTKK